MEVVHSLSALLLPELIIAGTSSILSAAAVVIREHRAVADGASRGAVLALAPVDHRFG